MSKGIANIGFIGGCLAKSYHTAEQSFITVLQRMDGSLQTIVVDDGLEIIEYAYAKPSSKVSKPKFVGILSGGTDS